MDREERQGCARLSLDIGGIERDVAVRYAQKVGEESGEDGTRLVMHYDDIVDAEGRLKVWDPLRRNPGERHVPYVTVMRMAVPELKPGARAALFAAATIEAGKGSVFPPETTSFSYHLRGRISTPAYEEQFASLVRALEQSFWLIKPKM